MTARILPLALFALACAACATANETAAPSPAPLAANPAIAAPAKPAVPTPPAESPPLPGEDVLNQQPALAPLADFAAPISKLVTLPNGLRIYLVARPGGAIESLAFVVKRGATADPPGLAGLASLSAGMLETGSGGKSQAEVAAAVDALGASLRTNVATDGTFVAISGIPLHAAEMISLLAEVALRPNLAAAEWTKLQARRVAELQDAMADPNRAAGLAFASALYGTSPLGQPALGTPASVQAAKLGDVKQFLATFQPAECALIAVGGAPADEVIAELTRAFASWKPNTKALAKASAGRGLRSANMKSSAKNEVAAKVPMIDASALAALPASERPRFVFVDFKDRPQTVLRVGGPGVPRSSPDALALRLFNSVLGDSFTSRLMQNLREAHGYTYGARSNFAFGRGPGPFAALASVKTAVTGPALAEMLREIDRALSEPFSDADMAKGKALMTYQLVEELQRTDGIAAALAEIFLDDLPLDECATFVPRLRALTAADVLAAATRTLKESEMTIAMAGDEAQVLPQIAAAGIVLPAPEPRDALGEKIPADGKSGPGAAKK